jgi:hypothetical protein
MKRLEFSTPPPSVTFCVESSQDDPTTFLSTSTGSIGSLIIFWPTMNVLKKYMLPSSRGNKVEEEDGDATDDSSGAIENMENMTDDEIIRYKSKQLLIWEWYSSASLTVATTDIKQEYYCVGTEDGSIFVLNIQNGTPLCVPRRHVSPKGVGIAISAISIYSQSHMVTGGIDGSIMVIGLSNINLNVRYLESLMIGSKYYCFF